MTIFLWVVGAVVLLLVLVTIYDLTQKKHAILRNFPVVGHFRYLLESVGPELRQYIVTNNDEERPFSRDQRSWIYASAKKQNNYFGFGTDNELETSSNYLIIKPAVFLAHHPTKGEADYDGQHSIACQKVLGEARDRKHAFRPQSVLLISTMNYGSLSGAAVEAMNRGCHIADSLHDAVRIR